MDRNAIREICQEIIDCEWVARNADLAGRCIALAAIVPSLLDELGRVEAERDRLFALAVELEFERQSDYAHERALEVEQFGGSSVDLDPGHIRDQAVAAVKEVMARGEEAPTQGPKNTSS